ncbi:substrate-binding domain-containing protein [Polymorphospora rubra]|uniref:substrate-binding domain-containing protein n=1 Tax=Polymorphospora rubra TaxID=338584 RepID=UPI0034118E80
MAQPTAGGNRRLPLIIAVVVGLVAVVGTYLVLRPDGTAGSGGDNRARGDCVQIEINASLEKGDLMVEMAESYNQTGRTFDGRCAAVSVHKTTSGAAMEAIANGWDPQRDGAPVPQVWSPSASLWLDLLEQRGASTDNPVRVEGDRLPVTQSPVVLAMPQPMAEALGWPNAKIGWSDVLALSSDPDGWGSRGHPEWGRFAFGKDNPHLSTSGLAATVTTYYAATGRSSDLVAADIADPKVMDFVRSVEGGVLHYADESMKFLANLAEVDAQGRAMSYVSAIVLQEQLVHLYNEGNPTGDRALFGKGRKPQVPLVAVHPADGMLMLDHPYVTLPSASDDQRAAAADFLSYMREDTQQRRFVELGFRDKDGHLDEARARSVGAPAGTAPSTISSPGPEILAKILDGWDTLRKKAQVMLVLDVSGSMDDHTGSGKTKMEAAKQAAIQALDLLHPEDEVALWTFSTPARGASEPYTERVPLSRIGANKAALTSAIGALRPEGGTALYSTVRDAHDHLVEHFSPDRINAVVVLTDGRNEYPRDNDLDQLLRDLDATDREQSVRIFSIAFGDKSDLGVLEQISKASRAAAYDARDPDTIDKVFISVLSNF